VDKNALAPHTITMILSKTADHLWFLDEAIVPKSYKDLSPSTQVYPLENITRGDDLWICELLNLLLSPAPWSMTLPQGCNMEALAQLTTRQRLDTATRAGGQMCIAFPTVVFRDPDGVYRQAPLILWEVEIKRQPGLNEYWEINRTENHRIFSNSWLQAFLNEQYAVGLDGAWRKMTSGTSLTRKQLDELISHFCKITPCEEWAHPTGYHRFGEIRPGFRELLIDRCLFLGWFPEQYEGFFPKLFDVPDVKSWNPANARKPKLALSLDIYQQKVIESALTNNTTYAAGPKGSGKSFLAGQLILDNLLAGRKTLYISANKMDLRRQHKKLLDLGLGHLAVHMETGRSGLPLLLEQMKTELANKLKPNPTKLTHWQLISRKLERLEQQYRDSLNPLSAKELEGQSWAETVNRFLLANKIESKEVLNSQLNSASFTFDEPTWHRTREQLQYLESVAGRYSSTSHPLLSLNDIWYKEEDHVISKQRVTAMLVNFLAEATHLHRRHLKSLDAYRHNLSQGYDLHARELRRRLEVLQDKLSDYESTLGPTFMQYEKQGLLNPVVELFNVNRGDIKEAAQDIAEDYRHLADTHGAVKHFDFKFLKKGEHTSIPKVIANLNQFSGAIEYWRQRLDFQLGEEVNRLTGRSTMEDGRLAIQIRQLEIDLESLLAKINHSGLLRHTVEHKMLTIGKRREFIEELLEKMHGYQNAMTEFEEYHGYRHNILEGGPQLIQLVHAMGRVRADRMVETYESWFLYHYLTNKFSVKFPESNRLSQEATESYATMQNLLPDVITHVWRDSRSLSINAWSGKKGMTIAEQATFNPRAIIESDTQMFSNRYPAWVMSPQAALQVLPDEMEFDLVIIDDVELISPELLPFLKQFGQRQLILGEPEGAIFTPYQAESLSLQWNHQDLTAVLHRLRQEIMPEMHETAPPKGNHPDSLRIGIRDETNLGYLLTEVFNKLGDERRHYPSIGILVANPSRAALLQRLILQFEQDTNSPRHAAFMQLMRSGFYVYDYTTIGRVDTDIMIAEFDAEYALNHTDLTQLLGNTNKELWLYADPYFSNLPGSNAAFLRQAEMLENEGELNWIPLQRKATPGIYSTIVETLGEYIDPYRIYPSSLIGGSSYPLLIAPALMDQPWQCILLDGCVDPNNRGSLLWESERFKAIKLAGVVMHHSWSVSWWRDPSVESRRVAGLVIQQDQIAPTRSNIQRAPDRTPKADMPAQELLDKFRNFNPEEHSSLPVLAPETSQVSTEIEETVINLVEDDEIS
jgi:hypothetical protein